REDEIEALPTLGEVLLRVVDDVVCADRSDQVHGPRAAHAGHLGAEGLGDLHGERPHASRRADDQHLVSRRDPTVIAQTLQRRQRGHWYGRRLVEREVGRFQLQEAIRDGYVFSKSAKPVSEEGPEHLVTWLELRDVLTDRFDLPCHVGTKDTVLRLAQPRLQARDVWAASHEVPVEAVDRSRVNAYQHLIVFDERLVDVLEF